MRAEWSFHHSPSCNDAPPFKQGASSAKSYGLGSKDRHWDYPPLPAMMTAQTRKADPDADHHRPDHHCRLGIDRKLHPRPRARRAKCEQGLNGSGIAVRGRPFPHLTAPVKRRLERIAGQKWTKDGAVVIFVQDTRSQARNREIARERLAEMIRAALVAPKPRRPTRPTKGSVERRIKAKKVRGEVKAGRGRVER